VKQWDFKNQPKCCKWCKGDKHFQARLRDLPGVLGKVGKMNCNATIEGQRDNSGMKSVKEGVIKLMSEMILLTHGTRRRIKSKTNTRFSVVNSGIDMRNQDTILVDGKGKPVIATKLGKVRDLFRKYEGEDVDEDIQKVIGESRVVIKERDEKIPNEYFNLFKKILGGEVIVERNTDPFSKNDDADGYTTGKGIKSFKCESDFQKRWRYDSVVQCASYEDNYKYMLKAITQTRLTGAKTVMMVRESNMNNLREEKEVNWIARWKKKEFKMRKRTNNTLNDPVCEAIYLCVVSTEKFTLTKDMKELLEGKCKEMNDASPSYDFKLKKMKKDGGNMRKVFSKFAEGIKDEITLEHKSKTRGRYLDIVLRNISKGLNVNSEDVLNMIKNNTIRRNNKKKVEVEEKVILEVKQKLEGTVVELLDKNTGQLYVKCPVLHYNKLKKNTMERKADYEKSKRNKVAILKAFEEEYKQSGLHKKYPWSKEGDLPILRLQDKDKDPEKGTRIIASYAKYPTRGCWKYASKIMTWMLNEIDEEKDKDAHFTLKRVDHFKKKLGKAEKLMKASMGENARIIMRNYDVREMYKNLDRAEIKKATDWLFKKTEERYEHKRKTRSNEARITVERYGRNEVRWGKLTPDTKTVDFTFEELKKVIALDFKYSYAMLGKVILKQKQGCPIGGLLSAIYANVVCAYQENSYLTSRTKTERKQIYGIRQMDDLLLFLTWNEKEGTTEENILQTCASFTTEENNV